MSPSWWDLLAPVYDRQARLEIPALRAALRLAAVTDHDRVLDAGCGTGQWLRLCRSTSQPARLVGVDRSAAMLARARSTDAELIRADLGALPFEDAEFDVVCVAFVLHLFSEQELESVLPELRRVLSDGGRIVTVTPSASPGMWGRIRSTFAARLAATRWRSMGGLRPFDPRARLEVAGFHVDASVETSNGYRSLCVRGIAR